MAFETDHFSIDRYLEGMIRVGRVTKVKTKNCVAATVTFPDRGFQSAYYNVIQRNTIGTQEYYVPVPGEPVWVLMHGRSLNRGLILGSAYTEGNPPPYNVQTLRGIVFADGSYVNYDTANGGNYTINTVGNVVITSAKNLTATITGSATIKAPTITLDGSVTITKDLTVQGNTSMKQAKADPNCTNIDGSGGGT
jgi:phage baseplate assembly protein V